MFSKIRLIIVFVLFSHFASAQFLSLFGLGEKKVVPKNLMQDRAVQIETTSAINNMYNSNFDAAEKEFKWLIVKYPQHPIGYFLLGLNEWWKIVPDPRQTRFDSKCEDYMDKAIDLADDIYDDDETNKEAAFFMACAYAFKGRLYAEREKWIQSAYAGKQAMKYLERCRGPQDLNPELLFGDGIYNYYSKWIHQNYPSLKPLLVFFKKGDKPKGINQLEEVSNNAFYTRMEARYFLVQIYGMEDQHQKAYNLSKMMHSLYPNNPFFHRYAARTAFILSKMPEAEALSLELLNNIDAGKVGYEATAGRYAAYIIAYINDKYNDNKPKAKEYYQKSIDFALKNKAQESGYSLGSHLGLGKIAEDEKDYLTAARHYKTVIDFAEKKSDNYDEAKKRILALKKKLQVEKKKMKEN